jgi:hypothetical protein
VLEEEAQRVNSARRGGKMVVVEKVTRVLDRSLFYKWGGDEGACNGPPNHA